MHSLHLYKAVHLFTCWLGSLLAHGGASDPGTLAPNPDYPLVLVMDRLLGEAMVGAPYGLWTLTPDWIHVRIGEFWLFLTRDLGPSARECTLASTTCRDSPSSQILFGDEL